MQDQEYLDQMQTDLKEFGFSDDEIKKRIDSYKEFFINETCKSSCSTSFELWEDNLQSLLIFIDCATQWRTAGMGGIVGLDYNAVNLVFKFQKVKKKRQYEIFKDIQICERVALDYFNKKNGD